MNIENVSIISNTENSTDIIDNKITARAWLNKLNQQDGSGKFFTENLGQVNNDNVKFYIQGQGVWFTSTSIIFELIEPSKISYPVSNKFQPALETYQDRSFESEIRKRVVLQLEFLNCNNVIPVGRQELQHRSNFFYGNDSSKWHTNVQNYREVVYKNIYDNIDLRYYFNENGLKYEFVVHKSGNPEDIIINVKGSKRIQIENKSDLRIETTYTDFYDKNLYVYQKHDDEERIISAMFKLIDSNSYGFQIIGEYDENISLIIDPLIFSTYLGGAWLDDSAVDIEADEDNNLYVTGRTNSYDFPVTNGSLNTSINGQKDIFALKLNSQGTTLIYSTFLGGTSDDWVYAHKIDKNGNMYITGLTSSDDFPTTLFANDTTFNGLFDVFITKLNSVGNALNYSTFIGGSGYDYSDDITLDEQNNAYITGYHLSVDFPTTPNAYQSTGKGGSDAFIVKLSNDGAIILYSTLIGGSEYDKSFSIALDSDNNVCILGETESDDFPTTSGAYKETFPWWGLNRGYISKFNTNLSTLLYSTSLWDAFGNPGYYHSNGISIDSNNNIIVTGIGGWGLPPTDDAFDKTYNGGADAGILKFDPTLSILLYATYLGGKEDDHVWDSVLDDYGNLYIVGETNSTDFPVLEGVFDTTYNGKKDVFIAKLNLNNSVLMYSSYIGGSGDDVGFGVAIAHDENIFVAGQAAPNFPTTSGSFDPTFNGGSFDAFALRLGPTSTPSVLDLNISETVVYRPYIIELYSNASDHEDQEIELIPQFEYMAPYKYDWSNNWLNTPVYNNDRWQTKFNIPKNASLGFYNFRVRYNDTDDMWTRWFYLNGSLLVLNNLPRIEYFNISNHSVVIGKKLELIFNATDVEDSPHELNPMVEYKPSSEPFWDPLEPYKLEYMGMKWEFTFSIPPGKPYDYYDFRVRVNDTDNDYSGWSYLNRSLFVRPAPPEIISITLSKPEINRTEQLEVYVNCSDLDTLPEDIYVELQYMSLIEGNWHNASAEYYGKLWESNLNSKKTWALGVYNFRARATDWEENESPWFYLNDSLRVLNNIPELLNIDNIPDRMDRGGSIVISIDAKDKENLEEELKIVFEYQTTGSLDWLNAYLSEPFYSDNHWNYDFNLPTFAPTGLYSFRARAGDLDDDWGFYIYLNDSLTVSNSIPAVVSFEQIPTEIYRTGTVMITADGIDLETAVEKLQCNIYYFEPVNFKWTKLETFYNSTGGQWYAELATTKTSVPGNYSFMVEFIDGDGAVSKPAYANRTVWVRNNLPVISTELDDISVGKTQYILKLDEYGYDVETPKGDLVWVVELNTIDNSLFHIEDENIGNQEIVIYPVKNKKGSDDLTLILIDADGGKAIIRDITVIVDSKTGGGGTDTDGEDSTISKLTESNFIWVYLIIIIIAIILITLYVFHRRKKKVVDGKEQLGPGQEQTKVEEEDQELTPGKTPSMDIAEVPAPEPVPVPVPVIEEPPEPVPVPMPVEVPKPQLPVSTSQVEELQEKEMGDVETPAGEVAINGIEEPVAAEEMEKEGTVESKSESEDAE